MIFLRERERERERLPLLSDPHSRFVAIIFAILHGDYPNQREEEDKSEGRRTRLVAYVNVGTAGRRELLKFRLGWSADPVDNRLTAVAKTSTLASFCSVVTPSARC